MRRTLLPLLALLTLAAVPLTSACGETSCGEVIEITTAMSYSENADEMILDPCVTSEVVGNLTVYDFSECCPKGYDFIYGTATTAICEENCGFAATASVDRIGEMVYVTHAVADAALDAVEELAAGAP